MRILGLDIGTQGVRGVVCDEKGRIFAQSTSPFDDMNETANPDFKEQTPASWEQAVIDVISACVKSTGGTIDALSLDATSGTIVALDENKKPLTNGIMYNDSRSKEQAARVHAAAGAHEKALGYKFNASFALPKILWIMENEPEVYAKTWKFVHQSDYIYGLLTGNYGISDYSNALKTGYDLVNLKWPSFIGDLGIDMNKLPAVVAPGEKIENISQSAACATGLKTTAQVFAGATDGFVSALSAGLAVPGEWATVIGTTMVLKGLTKNLVLDPEGRIYSHRHPQGWWLPGGASNVGGICLNKYFGKDKFQEYDKEVMRLVPTGGIFYPLTVKGERFPFVSADAQGFYLGDSNEVKKYAAAMEGVGYTERLSYELLQDLGCEVGDSVLTSGGACKSIEWLQIRADIMQKTLMVPDTTDAALGSAMLALSGFKGMKLNDAVSEIVSISKIVEPDAKNKARYDDLYGQFKDELKKRGYI